LLIALLFDCSTLLLIFGGDCVDVGCLHLLLLFTHLFYSIGIVIGSGDLLLLVLFVIDDDCYLFVVITLHYSVIVIR
jgi:hypothetical protein